MFTVYILSTTLDWYYVGYTSVLISKRLKKHLANHRGFTGSQSDWGIVYIKKYFTTKDALNRERQIKSWKNRTIVEKIIHSIE